VERPAQRPRIITESVRKAFKLAEYEKPGATHLEFPEDVAGSAVDATPMDSRERVRLASPDSGLLQRAQAFALKKRATADHRGERAVRTDATTRLREFVQTTGIPVASTYMGKGRSRIVRPSRC